MEEEKYYADNLEMLQEHYLGKHLLIKGYMLMAAFDSKAEAEDYVSKNNIQEFYLIKHNSKQPLPPKKKDFFLVEFILNILQAFS